MNVTVFYVLWILQANYWTWEWSWGPLAHLCVHLCNHQSTDVEPSRCRTFPSFQKVPLCFFPVKTFTSPNSSYCSDFCCYGLVFLVLEVQINGIITVWTLVSDYFHSRQCSLRFIKSLQYSIHFVQNTQCNIQYIQNIQSFVVTWAVHVYTVFFLLLMDICVVSRLWLLWIIAVIKFLYKSLWECINSLLLENI